MNSITRYSRRDLVSFGAVAGGIVLSGLPSAGTAAAREAESREETISANEDLMREHGVLRRVLIVYSRAANLLRNQSGKADLAALGDAAKLFREFGQQYHERTLEEEYVFPALRRSGGDVSRLVGVLIDQHRRGEEITGYILSVSGRGEIGEGEAGPLAKALDSLVRMYNAHTAWEDTVLFPAWTKTMSPGQREEMAGRFEALEHQRFGAQPFEDAVRRVARAEAALGIAGPAMFTAPAPPP